MSRKFTYEYVKEYIESFGYKLLSEEYIGAMDNLIIKCDKEHEFKMNFNNFKNNNQRCSVCAIKKRKESLTFSYEYVKEYIESFGYKLLSEEYINAQTKLLMICDEGHIYKATFNSFRNGRRCSCHKYENVGGLLTYEYVKEYIESFGYKLLSEEYIKAHEKLIVQCDKEHVYEVSYANFYNGKRCPRCHEEDNQSKGSKKIENFLLLNNVKYNKEYRFDDCKFYKTLPFDFYLPQYNTLVEYDGELHYKIIEHFGGLDDFIYRKIRDTVKTIYCKENNIRLIRIPYWEFNNIEKILNKIL